MEEIELIEKEIGAVIEIEERVPVWKMPSVMSKDFNSIFKHLKSKGINCREAPYARYLDIDWDLEMKKGASHIRKCMIGQKLKTCHLRMNQLNFI